MRIFTKKSFRFDHPQGRDKAEPVVSRALDFLDAPDWVKESSMFKLAFGAGEIDLPESKAEENAVEVAAHEEKASRRKVKAQPESGE